jgi:hypothetical protein
MHAMVTAVDRSLLVTYNSELYRGVPPLVVVHCPVFTQISPIQISETLSVGRLASNNNEKQQKPILMMQNNRQLS